ncbi:hypothetical protein OZX67_09360 [Bifidobacterium sp. ESL0728]|uniref:hypothetical protein n=1 Tax=Bifidobacterium sp. ESL0728 TaxID=2983220 RepID=UPI0023F7B59D|nr:hypothetical protein [Bifidobacterium sp. ESL0728]WEV58974.1 hypothetical protein OZX67_09360 [Bifidobacterium sp. ESL0728]
MVSKSDKLRKAAKEQRKVLIDGIYDYIAENSELTIRNRRNHEHPVKSYKDNLKLELDVGFGVEGYFFGVCVTNFPPKIDLRLFRDVDNKQVGEKKLVDSAAEAVEWIKNVKSLVPTE